IHRHRGIRECQRRGGFRRDDEGCNPSTEDPRSLPCACSCFHDALLAWFDVEGRHRVAILLREFCESDERESGRNPFGPLPLQIRACRGKGVGDGPRSSWLTGLGSGLSAVRHARLRWVIQDVVYGLRWHPESAALRELDRRAPLDQAGSRDRHLPTSTNVGWRHGRKCPEGSRDLPHVVHRDVLGCRAGGIYGPNLRQGAPSTWDADGYAGTSIGYPAWRLYTEGSQAQHFTIGVASSNDGYNWRFEGDQPLLRPNTSQAWESVGVGGPSLVESLGWLYYSGSNGYNWRIGLAQLNPDGYRPEGTYTSEVFDSQKAGTSYV